MLLLDRVVEYFLKAAIDYIILYLITNVFHFHCFGFLKMYIYLILQTGIMIVLFYTALALRCVCNDHLV